MATKKATGSTKTAKSTTKATTKTSTKKSTTTTKTRGKSGSGSKSATKVNGEWKTINGVHVFIENGKITKGPANFRGKKVSEVKGASGGTKSSGKSSTKTSKGKSDVFESKEYVELTQELNKARVDSENVLAKRYQVFDKLVNTYVMEHYGGKEVKSRAEWNNVVKWVRKQKEFKDCENELKKCNEKHEAILHERMKLFGYR